MKKLAIFVVFLLIFSNFSFARIIEIPEVGEGDGEMAGNMICQYASFAEASSEWAEDESGWSGYASYAEGEPDSPDGGICIYHDPDFPEVGYVWIPGDTPANLTLHYSMPVDISNFTIFGEFYMNWSDMWVENSETGQRQAVWGGLNMSWCVFTHKYFGSVDFPVDTIILRATQSSWTDAVEMCGEADFGCGDGIIEQEEIIVDNVQAIFEGEWFTSSATDGYHGYNYRHDNNAQDGQKKASYFPNLDGEYEVYINYPAHENRAESVPVSIVHSDGIFTHYVNQRQGGSWDYLGEYDFDSHSFIFIENVDTNGFVIADAFKFSRTEECDDGNTQNGDGCSESCVVEEGWECNGQPSVCDCLVGYTNCDGECVNIMEDEDHCGECFNPCDPYYECMGGWCELVCVDSDGDTFNVNEEECGPMDCDDSDSSIYPGAEEICDDGIDQDCDGEDCYEGIEYCNNCVDDEGDGLVDCEDPECFDDPFCINLEYSGKGAVTRYSYSKGALAYSKFDDINECNDVDESKFYYQDRMGNNRVTINQEGEVSNFKSLPYGQVIQGGIKKGFVNKQMENGSGLYYFGARFYDPDLGRFTSVDPVAENEPYSYVANNPMMYTDPTGMYLNLDLLWVEKMASGDFASAEQESVGAAGVSDEEAEMKAWEKFYEENIYYEGIEQDDIYRGPYEPLQGEPNPFGIMGIRDAGLLDPIPWLAGVAAVNLLKAGAGALAGSARQKIFITYKTPVEGVGGAGASVPAGFKTVFVNSADEVLSVIKNNPGAIFAYEMHGTPFALYKFASGGPLARSALVNAFAKARAAAVIDGSCWGSYALPLYENAGISAIASYQNTIPGVGRVITTSHGTVSIGSVAHLARAYPRLSSLNSGIYSYGRHTAMTRLHPNTATFDLAGFARYVGN